VKAWLFLVVVLVLLGLAFAPLPEQIHTIGNDDPALTPLPWSELVAPGQVWPETRTRPELDGQTVKLAGYVVPLDMGWGGMREFLLVPYAGACIHTPPPPANQIVHIVAPAAVKGLRAMDVVWVSGRLHVQQLETGAGTSGYQLEASHVAPYR
jgi:hypothetical protein